MGRWLQTLSLTMPTSLFARLSLVFFCVLLILGLFSIWASHQLNQKYFLENHQQLNAPIAMYMAEQVDLTQGSAPSATLLADLSEHVMVVNPSITVYLLDNEGTVIAPKPDTLEISHVALEPIQQFLNDDAVYPLFGDNPASSTTQNIFSVWPLTHNSIDSTAVTQIGYVYIVLAGERQKSLLATFSSSYSAKSLVALLVCATALAILSGIFVFFQMTRRLHKLTQNAREWLTTHQLSSERNTPVLPRDEIDALAMTYDSMTEQLMSQYRQLARNDQNRREFFANISHDLRTPLTTMQSYLETLVIKQDTLDADSRNRYIRTAHRQSKRLRRLIMQLFELSQLSSREIAIKNEPFSALELAHDCAQDFALYAKRKGIQLSVIPVNDENASLEVAADIALIQRVFQNLISNAIRFTPSGGSIKITLDRDNSTDVTLSVSDTGSGIAQEQIDQIFNRHFPGIDLANQYTAATQTTVNDNQASGGSAGLGLSIVKNILDLHASNITVTSTVGRGTTFTFSLPAAQSSRLRQVAI